MSLDWTVFVKKQEKYEINFRERLSAWVRTFLNASRRGKKMLTSSRDRNEGTWRGSEGGGRPAM